MRRFQMLENDLLENHLDNGQPKKEISENSKVMVVAA